MKKFNAILGTLALSGSLFTGLQAHANTSTTTTSTTAPSVVDRMLFSYYGVYNGPSIANPNEFTSSNGDMSKDVQNLDSTFTGGYRITETLRLTGNYRFIMRPIFMMESTVQGVGASKSFVIRNKDPWIMLSTPSVLKVGGLNVSADIRGYIPAVNSKNMYGAVRMTQVSTIEVPTTRLTLGLFTFQRANMLTDAGAAGDMENISLVASPFANYQITPTVSATFWSDVVQLSYATVGSADLAQGWSNDLVPIQVGIGWDITPSVNLNPVLTVYPQNASLEKTSIGASLSARFL